MTPEDRERLVRIETLLEQLVGYGGRCAEHETRMAGYSTRIRKLELWRSWMAGAIAVIVFMVTVGGAVLVAKLK